MMTNILKKSKVPFQRILAGLVFAVMLFSTITTAHAITPEERNRQLKSIMIWASMAYFSDTALDGIKLGFTKAGLSLSADQSFWAGNVGNFCGAASGAIYAANYSDSAVDVIAANAFAVTAYRIRGLVLAGGSSLACSSVAKMIATTQNAYTDAQRIQNAKNDVRLATDRKSNPGGRSLLQEATANHAAQNVYEAAQNAVDTYQNIFKLGTEHDALARYYGRCSSVCNPQIYINAINEKKAQIRNEINSFTIQLRHIRSNSKVVSDLL